MACSESSGVLDMFLEQVTNDRGLLLPAVQVAAHGLDHFALVGRPALAQRIGFDILVEQLVRVELGAVARQHYQTHDLVRG